MTDKKPQTPTPAPPNTFEALRARLGLSVAGLAAYLGAPVPTVRKWLNGDRVPPAATTRLIEVLGLIEALAPSVHAHLMPSAPAAPAPAAKRSRARAAAPTPTAPEGTAGE